ncbi:transporter [Desulfovibrio aerotolerans]|uniref:Transporter n=1 Tax=Solidesulfovibrio aerotolerans TaxID=295255 RepID=A0A7C9MML5_9BACT|nr:transporter [Solidesulfovibrio aerotolerans]MYL81892.1 transporter [Solidesulfovibrio aerotolerans]
MFARITASIKTVATTVGILFLVLAALPQDATASEGGTSHYIQGAYGDFLMGYIPAQGFYVRNDTLYQSARMDGALKGGRAYAELKSQVVINITKLSYIFDVPAIGGFLGAGVGIPFIVNEHITGKGSLNYARRDRTTGLPHADVLNIGGGGDRGGLSDIFFMPVIAGWNFGECHLVFSPVIYLPTGYYNPKKLTNLGMNYTTFDPNLAFTWLNKSGFEFSTNVGYMINTENITSKYLSGNELHVDWTAAMHIKERYAIGAVGYFTVQTTPDTGSGASLGSFYSSACGIGPIVSYTMPVGGKELTVIGKWLHDIGATNRLHGDMVYGSLAINF